jgi:hypothetical protein
MAKLKNIGVVVLVVLAVVVGCKKSEEFVNPVFQCLCGSITWYGEPFELLMAEYVLTNDTILVSRKYFVTADVTLEGETKAHNMYMTFEVDSVTQGTFFVGDNDLTITMEEVNFNDPILPLRTFAPQEGALQIAPAIFGGTESVSFSFSVKEVFNGQPVGFDIPISGNLSVEVSN